MQEVPVLAGWGLLEWTFAAMLIALTGAVAIAALYIVVQLFRNPWRKPTGRRA